jgi:hypothetical protein
MCPQGSTVAVDPIVLARDTRDRSRRAVAGQKRPNSDRNMKFDRLFHF